MPCIHISAPSPYLANQWLHPPIWTWSRSGKGASPQTHTLGRAWAPWLPCWAGLSLWTTAAPTQTPKILHSESPRAHLDKNPLYRSWRGEKRDRTDVSQISCKEYIRFRQDWTLVCSKGGLVSVLCLLGWFGIIHMSHLKLYYSTGHFAGSSFVDTSWHLCIP